MELEQRDGTIGVWISCVSSQISAFAVMGILVSVMLDTSLVLTMKVFSWDLKSERWGQETVFSMEIPSFVAE